VVGELAAPAVLAPGWRSLSGSGSGSGSASFLDDSAVLVIRVGLGLFCRKDGLGVVVLSASRVLASVSVGE